ncbi:MAG: calcium-binding protein, partial [Pseudomonadota bacterium]
MSIFGFDIHHNFPSSVLTQFDSELNRLFPNGNPFNADGSWNRTPLFRSPELAAAFGAAFERFSPDLAEKFGRGVHLPGDNHPGLRSFLTSKLNAVLGDGSPLDDIAKKAALMDLDRFVADVARNGFPPLDATSDAFAEEFNKNGYMSVGEDAVRASAAEADARAQDLAKGTYDLSDNSPHRVDAIKSLHQALLDSGQLDADQTRMVSERLDLLNNYSDKLDSGKISSWGIQAEAQLGKIYGLLDDRSRLIPNYDPNNVTPSPKPWDAKLSDRYARDLNEQKLKAGAPIDDLSRGIGDAGRLASTDTPDFSRLPSNVQDTLNRAISGIDDGLNRIRDVGDFGRNFNPDAGTAALDPSRLGSVLDGLKSSTSDALGRLANATSPQSFKAAADGIVNAFNKANADLQTALSKIPFAKALGFAGTIGDIAEFAAAVPTAFNQFSNGDINGALQTLANPLAGIVLTTAASYAAGLALAALGGPPGLILAGMLAAGIGVGYLWDQFIEANPHWLDDLAAFFNPPYYDPLVVDLFGDGIELTRLEGSTTYFDLDGDGYAERTGWVSPNDALLAIDRNGDGIINDISELFGDENTSGFADLALFDSDSNGIINDQDAAFSDLLLWRDVDGDGRSAPGELMSLDEAGLVSVSLDAAAVSETSGGNLITETATVSWGDGTQTAVSNVAFDISQARSVGTISEDLTITDLALSLPWLMGYGEVDHSLIEHAENSVLRDQAIDLLETAAQGSFDTFEADFDDYLAEWAGVSNVRWLDEAGLVSTIFVYDNDDIQRVEDARPEPVLVASGSSSYSTPYVPDINPSAYVFVADWQIEDGRPIPAPGILGSNVPETVEDLNYYFPGFYEWLSDNDYGLKSGIFYNPLALSFRASSGGGSSSPPSFSQIDAYRNPLGVMLEDGELASVCSDGEVCAFVRSSTSVTMGRDGAIRASLSFGEGPPPEPEPPMGGGMEAEHFAFLQQIFGQNYRQSDNFIASPGLLVQSLTVQEANDLEEQYQVIKNSMAAKFLVQAAASHEALYPGGELGALRAYDALEYNPFADSIDGSEYQFSVDAVAAFRGVGQADTETTKWLGIFLEEIELSGAFAAHYRDFDRALVQELTGRTVLDGTDNSETISSLNGESILLGHGGDDTINGSRNNNVIVGGAGDDRLIGHAGGDRYYYSFGDGNDHILDVDLYGNSGTDTLSFANAASDEVTLMKGSSDDLVVTMSNGETVTVQDHFWENYDRSVERIIFSDGVSL